MTKLMTPTGRKQVNTVTTCCSGQRLVLKAVSQQASDGRTSPNSVLHTKKFSVRQGS